MPGQANGSRLLHEQLVAATGDRGQCNPLARYLLAQEFQSDTNCPGRAGRIGKVPVTREADDMKLRQLSNGGHGLLAYLQTLKRKCMTSPSCMTYSLPSSRSLPASRAPFSPLWVM